jgi:hypothetical protein
VVLRAFSFKGCFLGCSIPSVATKHPPTETDHAGHRDEEGQAHPQPRRHPFAGEIEHESIIAKTMSALRL